MENLRDIPFEALVGTVETHPWFGAAQRVLCERMSLMGGRELAREMVFFAALHVASRRKISCVLKPNAFSGENILRDYAFGGVPAVQKKYGVVDNSTEETAGGDKTEKTPVAETEEKPVDGGTAKPEPANKNYRGAGDYFSREQYEQVKGNAGGVASETAKHTSDIKSFNLDRDVSLEGFCTEALAEIYAEQGYFERAKDIYAKLILAEPEKNTYFASLVEKLNEKI